jgi:hypothetical protein
MSTVLPAIKLALGSDFLTAFSKLPEKQQKKVRRFLEEFSARPSDATHNYEKIQGATDPNLRSVRIDGDYRGIVLKPETGNVYVLLWVDKHDNAYAWAERRTCSVHPATGTMQIVLTREAANEAVAHPATSQATATSAKTVAPTVTKVRPLFSAYSDDDLASLSIPSSLLTHVRAVCHEDEIDGLEAILPREAFEAVFLLGAGYTVEEARNELGISLEAKVDTGDFAAAVERIGTRRQFVVITDSAEMEKILAAPIDQWRVFLHPSQRRLVEMQAGGPVRVLGSAGTGKTVVAMHRAVWLARHVCTAGQKVLFTTFTKNLATDISEALKTICRREEWERMEVIHLDAWSRRFLDKQGGSLKLTYQDGQAEELWAKALTVAALPATYTPRFLRDEWDNAVQAHGIETLDAYLALSRVGRTQRLGRLERKQIWPVFAEYRALLSERGLFEPADAYRSAYRLIADRKISLPYRAVVIDEAQDFGNEAFRLLRALVPIAANDMFICGDSHQRLYGHNVVLSRCGVDIRGRGKKLRINYRTTEEIKTWSHRLLEGQSFDDLDAGVDDDKAVRSIVHGDAPELHKCTSVSALNKCVTEQVRAVIAGGTQPANICVVAATHREVDALLKSLETVCPEISRIETGQPDAAPRSALRVATIHRVKGLEFDHVILAGKLAGYGVGEITSENRSLLYVAATRARKSLTICHLLGA